MGVENGFLYIWITGSMKIVFHLFCHILYGKCEWRSYSIITMCRPQSSNQFIILCAPLANLSHIISQIITQMIREIVVYWSFLEVFSALFTANRYEVSSHTLYINDNPFQDWTLFYGEYKIILFLSSFIGPFLQGSSLWFLCNCKRVICHNLLL